jgi:hypothetical protein
MPWPGPGSQLPGSNSKGRGYARVQQAGGGRVLLWVAGARGVWRLAAKSTANPGYRLPVWAGKDEMASLSVPQLNNTEGRS